MDTIGKYAGAGRTLSGDLTVTFIIPEDVGLINQLKETENKDLHISVNTIGKKHSDRARKYMWKLCDLIAQAIKSDKDTVYIMALRDSGVFDYLEIPEASIDSIKRLYRYIEQIGDHTAYRVVEGEEVAFTMAHLRCYEGSHNYDTKEYSALINWVVRECNDLGIPTLTENEFRRLAGIKEE